MLALRVVWVLRSDCSYQTWRAHLAPPHLAPARNAASVAHHDPAPARRPPAARRRCCGGGERHRRCARHGEVAGRRHGPAGCCQPPTVACARPAAGCRPGHIHPSRCWSGIPSVLSANSPRDPGFRRDDEGSATVPPSRRRRVEPGRADAAYPVNPSATATARVTAGRSPMRRAQSPRRGQSPSIALNPASAHFQHIMSAIE